MIRRAFWLGAGAAAGILGYRRACALGRKVSGNRTARLTARGAFGVARESVRFTRDVREGMDLYMARHDGPAASTLETRTAQPALEVPEPDQKDGR